MTIERNILLIGDSNFLISHKNHVNRQGEIQEVSLGRLLEANSLVKDKLKVKNISIWGASLFDFYKTYIVKGPIPNHEIEAIAIGFGTNDSNYYYSLNSHLCSAELHYALLEHMIKILFASSETLKRVLLVPVPPVLIKSDNKRNNRINKCIEEFNIARQRLAANGQNQILYANEVQYVPTLHLIEDGYHLNSSGIEYLATSMSKHFLGEK